MKPLRPLASLRAQTGATAVEFALVLTLFLTFFLALLDASRMLYTWNAASEAARAGARFAVVCDDSTRADLVRARVQALLPQAGTVSVQWQPTGCDPSRCTGVTVALTKLDYQWISPIAGLAALAPIRMPEFSSYLPRERMRQDTHSTAFCAS